MTTPTRPTTSVTESAARYVDHLVVGTSDQVAAMIRRHHQAGTFIAMAAPRPVAPGDPRIRVRIRLTAPTAGPAVPATVHIRPAPPATARGQVTTATRTGRRVGIALTTSAAVIGLVFALGQLAARLTADAVTNAAATVAGSVAIAAIAVALIRGGSGGERHCPGCK